jgi:hypothetical protein
MIRGRALLGVVVVAGCFTAENTAPPPGDVEKFDPIAGFAAMAAYAGPQAKLVRMSASYVKTDGTMDLTAEYRPNVSAQFVANASAEDVAAQGARAPGSGYEVGDALDVRLSVYKPRIQHVSSGGSEWDEKNLGMERSPGSGKSMQKEFAAAPTCSFKDLWAKALAAGAPADVVANIDYDKDGYTFAANGRDFRRRFAADCSLLPAD